jgi:hypothetical protein
MKINGHEFTIGADPEFFVCRNGIPVSAHGLIPGDKKNPLKVNKGAVQVDGMALEFNIDPAATQEEFLINLDVVMKTIMEMVPGYQMYDKPVAEFGFDYIDAQPNEAKVLGCEPDFNAYTAQANPRPDAATPFRTASGHLHIGWTKDVNPLDPGHFEACCTLAKMLDVKLGVPSLLWDTDQKRRLLYGKAGCFRPKSYGMEYRTLSNAWLDPQRPYLRKMVFSEATKGIKELFDNDEAWNVKMAGMSAQEVIDSDDRKKQETAISQAIRYQKVCASVKEYREAV